LLNPHHKPFATGLQLLKKKESTKRRLAALLVRLCHPLSP
jgi:hypothetical protein